MGRVRLRNFWPHDLLEIRYLWWAVYKTLQIIWDDESSWGRFCLYNEYQIVHEIPHSIQNCPLMSTRNTHGRRLCRFLLPLTSERERDRWVPLSSELTEHAQKSHSREYLIFLVVRSIETAMKTATKFIKMALNYNSTSLQYLLR